MEFAIYQDPFQSAHRAEAVKAAAVIKAEAKAGRTLQDCMNQSLKE